MFSNFAWSEMLVIAAVAIIVVGPKDLPGMLRQLGKTIGGVKRMAGDFQRQFNDAIKEADLDELKDMTSTKGFGPLEDARKSMEDLTESLKDPMEADPQVEVAPPQEPETKPAAKKRAARKPAPKKQAAKKPAAKAATPKKAAPAKKPATSKAASAKKPVAKSKSA